MAVARCQEIISHLDTKAAAEGDEAKKAALLAQGKEWQGHLQKAALLQRNVEFSLVYVDSDRAAQDMSITLREEARDAVNG